MVLKKISYILYLNLLNVCLITYETHEPPLENVIILIWSWNLSGPLTANLT